MDDFIFTDTMAAMDWKELGEKSKAGIPVLLPLGVIEEHGPHLPLGTDLLYSLAVCRRIKAAMAQRQAECLIAPPYYWGINHCTSAFPGSFSLKPETMRMVLRDLFANLHQFGFTQVYCVNDHGDPFHVSTILESIRQANETHGMQIRLLMEPHDLGQYQLTGREDYILLDEAEYPQEVWAMFAQDQDKNGFDLHAGAYETAAMEMFYPGIVRRGFVEGLPPQCLREEQLPQWLAGGEAARELAPDGYAGNPAGFEAKQEGIALLYRTLTDYYAARIAAMRP